MSAYVDATGVTNLTADIKALADATYPANEAVAPEYDATSAYEIGDYCIYSGMLYKCNTAIAIGGEAWNAAHWTQVSVVDELGSGGSSGLKFFNTSVATSAFVADQTYADYGYRAAVALTGVTSSTIPEVVFALLDATSGIFAPIAESYNGGVYIYASEVPSNSILIPTIICWS